MKKIRQMADRIFRWGTRIFETDMRYVLTGSFWITAAQGVASLASFLLAIAFAHYMSKEDYGIYRYVLSVAGLISAFSLSGLSTAILQAVSRGFERSFKDSLLLSMKWSLGMIAIALGISAYYFINQNPVLGVSMIFLAAGAPLVNATLLYRSFLNGRKQFRTTAFSNMIMNVVPAEVIFVTLYFTGNPLYTVIAYFASNSLVGYIIHSWTMNRFRPNDNSDPETVPYAKHLSVINILDMISTNLDKVLLFQFLGAASLSIYSFAIALPEQVRNLFRAIPTLAVPKLSEKTTGQIHQVIYKKIFKLFIVTVPVIVVYYFAAPLVYGYFFPQYLESVPYSQLFILILLVEGGLAGSVFEAKMAIREQYIVNIVGNVVKIGLLIFFTISYGIWGVIIARLLSRYFGFALSFILLKRMS